MERWKTILKKLLFPGGGWVALAVLLGGASLALTFLVFGDSSPFAYISYVLSSYNSVQVEVKGYQTSTKSLSASRTYPNLSDADLSLVPKTVQEGGRTLNLADVKWSSSTDMEGEDMVVRYTATASYTGSVSGRYATGYTVTADYTGEVAKTNCEIVTYTAIFGCTDVPYVSGCETVAEPSHENDAQGPDDTGPEEEAVSPDDTGLEAAPVSPEDTAQNNAQSAPYAMLSIIGCAGGIISLAVAGMWGVEKMKERKSNL